MRILIIKNKLTYSIAKDIDEFKNFLIFQGFQVSFDFKECDLPLKFKSFGMFGGNNYWGLDGMKKQLREEALVEPLKWDMVFFCYEPPINVGGQLANFTFPNDINGAAYCEIVYTPNFVGINGKILIHESIHAMNRILAFKGINIIDTLDNDNNWTRVLNFYKPLFPRMEKEYSLLKKIGIITGLLKFYRDLLERKQKADIEKYIYQTAIDMNCRENYEAGLATLKCESSLNPKARYVNKDKTVDRGIAQFNSKWYSNITDKESYDYKKAIPYFWKYFSKRPQDWICYSSGKYKDYL